MQRKHLLFIAVSLVALAFPPLCARGIAQAMPGEVRVEQSWGGEIKIELRDKAPQNGFIVNEEAWNKLWKAYRGNEETPRVDFSRQMVLVGVNKDPNRISLMPLTLSETGDLTVNYASTKVGYVNPKTCTYLFTLISRQGVKTVNGIPVPQA